MFTRTHFAAAAAAAASVLAIVTPVGAASAATTPVAAGAICAGPLMNTFVPPSVGPITVDLGPTIISGRIMNPGLHVSTVGISLPPICWKSLW
jgi:hypothetical protein